MKPESFALDQIGKALDEHPTATLIISVIFLFLIYAPRIRSFLFDLLHKRLEQEAQVRNLQIAKLQLEIQKLSSELKPQELGGSVNSQAEPSPNTAGKTNQQRPGGRVEGIYLNWFRRLFSTSSDWHGWTQESGHWMSDERSKLLAAMGALGGALAGVITSLIGNLMPMPGILVVVAWATAGLWSVLQSDIWTAQGAIAYGALAPPIALFLTFVLFYLVLLGFAWIAF